ISICQADTGCNIDAKNLFLALLAQPIGLEFEPALLVSLCNGHRYFNFPEPQAFLRLKTEFEPLCRNEQFSHSQLLNIALACASFDTNDRFVGKLQDHLFTPLDLCRADLGILNKLAAVLSRHKKRNEDFILCLLRIQWDHWDRMNEHMKNRFLYAAVNLS